MLCLPKMIKLAPCHLPLSPVDLQSTVCLLGFGEIEIASQFLPVLGFSTWSCCWLLPNSLQHFKSLIWLSYWVWLWFWQQQKNSVVFGAQSIMCISRTSKLPSSKPCLATCVLNCIEASSYSLSHWLKLIFHSFETIPLNKYKLYIGFLEIAGKLQLPKALATTSGSFCGPIWLEACGLLHRSQWHVHCIRHVL